MDLRIIIFPEQITQKDITPNKANYFAFGMSQRFSYKNTLI